MPSNKNENGANNFLFKASINTEDEIYEMVYDRINRKTSFVKATRGCPIQSNIEEAEIGGQKYKPLPRTNQLVEKGIILFPSEVTHYETEQEIIDEIRSFIHKHLEVTEVFEQIATYYVLFTWMFDRFKEVPYLRAIGDFGSGKSRMLKTVGSLCYKPVFTSGATTVSPIFRIIDEVHGTLVLDEADFRISDMTADIVKILNSGYEKGCPVMRVEGKDVFEVKVYDVFCPKIVATRETFADKALESRFLIEEMGVAKLRSDIPRTLDDSFYNDAESIRNKLLMWRLKNYFEPIELRQEVIEGIHPRLNQIVIPLLSIIKDAGIREHLKSFIVKYNAELVAERGTSWESDIVLSVLRLEDRTGLTEVTIQQVTNEVNRENDASGETLTAKSVGWYLNKKLLLKSYRTRKGFVISFAENSKRLGIWKQRYGITDSDIKCEQVNNVNVVEENLKPEGVSIII